MPRYISNDTASPIFVAGRLIPAFDGRHFEDHELPPEHKPEAVEVLESTGPTLAEEIRELLEGTVKDVSAKLPGLTFEALDLILDIEPAGDNRTTLLQAVRAEKIARADEQLRKDQEATAAAALEDARQALLRARVALINLPPDTPEEARNEAAAAVNEAQAKVDALAPAPAA
jgi:hypothetical protein